ncbi:hypothetical protein Hanom_Chr09g00792731 [Helianthus anomalus]
MAIKLKRLQGRNQVTATRRFRKKKAKHVVAVSDVGSRKGKSCTHQSVLDDYVIVDDSPNELELIGAKTKPTNVVGSKSEGSTASKDQPSGATTTSAPTDEGGPCKGIVVQEF